MTRFRKALIVVVVASLGLWGCAKGPAGTHAGQNERIRSLEGKCAKLEDDYRAVAGARDQFRKRLDGLLADRDRLQKELATKRVLLKERDALRLEVNSRTVERDALQNRCDRLKKGLQNLIGQDEALQASPTPAGTTLAATR